MKMNFLAIFVLCLFLFGCEKEKSPTQLNEYFKCKIDGEKKSWGPPSFIAGGQFECSFLGDSALFIAVKSGVESISFYLKSHQISDGTYTLDQNYKGFYTSPKDYQNYRTTATATGTLTIKKSFYQSYGTIPILEGQFSFIAMDTATGKTINIAEGKFIMERRNY
jgi:hypothetical protein